MNVANVFRWFWKNVQDIAAFIAIIAFFTGLILWAIANFGDLGDCLNILLREQEISANEHSARAEAQRSAPVQSEKGDVLEEKAVITSHREKQKVTTPEYLEGECRNIPEGTYLWVVVRPKFIQEYQPQSNQQDHGPISNGCDGVWEGIAYIGASPQTDINGRFEILLVGVDIQGNTIMQNYLIEAHQTNRWHGFRQLPEFARIYQKMTVIRQ
uniref:Uncharacterized protein n=1 Tax=Candidatus Kentrum sp. DK TaxID=2126562 RepID=A0A450SCA4_9GAMM|nr:MAG: hypothetical protein BECKDK2373C_GA0170839_102710 [Candidatus Kentron sp. DK]